jgi:Fic family protein
MSEDMDNIKDKYNMAVEDNIFFAKRNIVDSIYKSARLEGLAVTFPDTYSVVNSGVINGMSIEDALIINNLKHAWQFILDSIDSPVNLGYVCQIHKHVGEEPFTPDLLIEADVRDEIAGLIGKENVTDRAISLMLHLSRRQMFNDGNKRVAMLAANKVMIAGGAGIISVSPEKISDFVRCLTDYYRSRDMGEAKAFVYEHCVKGI